MQRLELNLASQPFRNNTLLWLFHGGSLLLLLTASAWAGTAWYHNHRVIRELRGTATNVEEQSAQLQAREQVAREGIAGHDLKQLQTRVDKANEIIHWKAFSWTRLFNRLEDVQPY